MPGDSYEDGLQKQRQVIKKQQITAINL